MRGTNTLILNKAETIKAIEYYLNKIHFQKDVTVDDVKQVQGDNLFEIKLIEKSEDEEDD